MKYCFLDLETTGFEPSKDSIIEVSLVVFENDQEIGRLDRVIIPDKSPLSDFVSQLTGINQAEIDSAGVYFSEIKEELQGLVNDTIIVGHNIDFDINFLVGNGIDVGRNDRIDTHELARILLPQEPSFALEVLTKNYGFTHESAHRAMSDVLASKRLFEMLVQKINTLPQEFLDKINGFLSHETTWYARHLFLQSSGGEGVSVREEENLSEAPAVNVPNEILEPLQNSQNVFVRVGDTRAAVETQAATVKELVKSGQKVCVVTPKLAYFPYFASLPTPGVLFDLQRCPAFLAARGNQLNNADTTFYLKCLYRHYLGYRGLWHFDLFFKERDLWKEVNAQGTTSEIFSAVALEKATENVLVCSPAAWAELKDEPVLEGRTLIIDEGELCAENWLQAPVKMFSFHQLLHHPNEDVAKAAQFFIGRFVREFMEPILNKSFGSFPERLLLEFKDQLDRFKDELETLLPENEKEVWLPWLSPADEKLVRWVTYAPESGNLSFHAWHPDAWRDIKNKLHQSSKLITARHNLALNDRLFFRVFMGEVEGEIVDIRDKSAQAELIIPSNLVSHNSPDFNAFCADKINTIFQNAESNVAANFSSLETLRNTFDALQPQMTEAQFLAAEKVMGGDGKMLEKLKAHSDKKILLLFQKILNPELENYEWSDLVVQKFPFGAPDPLLQKLEAKMKETGHNWFSAWVMPRLTSTLGRKIGQFPKLKTVHFLDPRENSKWGKAVLKDLFR